MDEFPYEPSIGKKKMPQNPKEITENVNKCDLKNNSHGSNTTKRNQKIIDKLGEKKFAILTKG